MSWRRERHTALDDTAYPGLRARAVVRLTEQLCLMTGRSFHHTCRALAALHPDGTRYDVFGLEMRPDAIPPLIHTLDAWRDDALTHLRRFAHTRRVAKARGRRSPSRAERAALEHALKSPDDPAPRAK